MRKKRRYGRLILILTGVFILGLLFLGGPNGLIHILSLRKRKAELEREQEILKAKIEILKYERYKLKYDPNYIKRIAKERFRMREKKE